MLTDREEPEYFERVIYDQHKNEWVKTIHKKIKSLNESYIYDLVKSFNLQGNRVLKNKQV